MPLTRATHPGASRRLAILIAGALGAATVVTALVAPAAFSAPAASAAPTATPAALSAPLQQALAGRSCVWSSPTQLAALVVATNCNGIDIVHADRDAIPALADALILPADPAAWTGDYAFTSDQAARLTGGFRIQARDGDLAVWTRAPLAPIDLPTL